jgi:uncharacterized protein YbaR (Trm112 family)
LNLIELVVCPLCCQGLTVFEDMAVCKGGHRFIIEEGIIDLMPTITDKNLLNEVVIIKINLNHNIGIRSYQAF